MSEIAAVVNTANPALCPEKGTFCPARELLIRLYAEPVPEEIKDNLPGGFDSDMDGLKLQVKLTENAVVARAIGCSGEEDGFCPARRIMDDSRLRRTAVSGIRRFRSYLRPAAGQA